MAEIPPEVADHQKIGEKLVEIGEKLVAFGHAFKSRTLPTNYRAEKGYPDDIDNEVNRDLWAIRNNMDAITAILYSDNPPEMPK